MAISTVKKNKAERQEERGFNFKYNCKGDI